MTPEERAEYTVSVVLRLVSCAHEKALDVREGWTWCAVCGSIRLGGAPSPWHRPSSVAVLATALDDSAL